MYSQNARKEYRVELQLHSKPKLTTIEVGWQTFKNDWESRKDDDYRFICVGFQSFSEKCIKKCRDDNKTVVYVSAQHALKDKDKVSHHNKRAGYGFPSTVVSDVCFEEGYTIVNGIPYSTARNSEQDLARLAETDERSQARRMMKEIYPQMPEENIAHVIEHSFKEGTGRIGEAKDMPLAFRVQLAVTAHVRHKCTNYDQLLHEPTDKAWRKARKAVEKPMIDTFKRWRGGKDVNDQSEEYFREVIVLDDSDTEVEEDEYHRTYSSTGAQGTTFGGLPRSSSSALYHSQRLIYPIQGVIGNHVMNLRQLSTGHGSAQQSLQRLPAVGPIHSRPPRPPRFSLPPHLPHRSVLSEQDTVLPSVESEGIVSSRKRKHSYNDEYQRRVDRLNGIDNNDEEEEDDPLDAFMNNLHKEEVKKREAKREANKNNPIVISSRSASRDQPSWEKDEDYIDSLEHRQNQVRPRKIPVDMGVWFWED